ncbi:MAG: TonB family protein [Moraxellaceae bacterium]
MTSAMMHHLEAMLPWDDLPSDEERKRRITIIMLTLALLISLLIMFVKVPAQPRSEADAVPERIARVIERKVELPPPPPPKPKEEVKEEAPKEEASKPKEAAKPAEVAQAKVKASKIAKEAGLDSLASLREEFDVPVVGTGGLITSTQEAGTSRNLLTSRAGAGSGVGTAYAGGVSSGFGGGKAGGKGSAGMMGKGGGNLQAVASGIGTAAAASKVGKDGKSRRTTEDIRKIFDQYGGKLNNAYQRALRDDPTMQGTLRVKLTIAPDGSVTSASVASSQLNNAELESKMLSIVRGFNFGAEEVEIWTGTYDINFVSN